MLNGHLSDEQIQELALGSQSRELLLHADNCEQCKTKIHNYRLLISAVEKQPAPAFGFDLAAAVVSQIETAPAKTATKGLWWLCACTITAILVAAGIYFGGYMVELAEELKSIVIYLVAISGMVLIVMLVIDQYKTYQKKMKMLDMQ